MAVDGVCRTFEFLRMNSSASLQFRTFPLMSELKEALYRIWCGVSRIGDSGVNRLGDTSAFVNPAGQLLLTRRGKTRMDTDGIVFEFYTAPL